jgi:hypothetical protein
MSDPIAGPAAPPKRVLIVAAIMAVLACWFLLHTYTNAGARECRTLYHAARSAADTARIDTLITEGSRAQNEPRTCGFMRHAAWWR